MFGHCLDVAWLNQEAPVAVSDHIIRPKGTNSGGDDRFSHRHGLEDRSGKAFAEGGMDQDVHQRQDLEGVPPPSQEDDMVHV